MLHTKYYNPLLKIGLVSWREAWLFQQPYPEKLLAEIHKGKLLFRQRGSPVRISYIRLHA